LTTALIFGCGGHAKSVFDAVVREAKLDVVGFVDKSASTAGFMGKTVFAEADVLSGHVACEAAVLGIGDNVARRALYEALRGRFPDTRFSPVIDPTAIISPSARIGAGTVVLARAVVNTAAALGRFSVLNTGAIVEHDCVLHDFASLGPAAVIGGNCRVGAASHVGIGAAMKHGVSIGTNTVLGGGAIAVENLGDNAVYLGVPARRARDRGADEPIF
jgi:sugar O-acyltransferase (sialic acid O-acetyltransferase NeuD family)